MLTYKRWYSRPLMIANRTIMARLRQSAFLAWMLFRVHVRKGERPAYWDYTTLVLKKAIRREIPPGSRILEVGIGEHAILTIYACKTIPELDCTGVDIAPEAARRAVFAVKNNHVRVEIRCGDMFDCCDGLFDAIFWNPPYVPKDVDSKYIIGDQDAVQSDGGELGTSLIERFLAEVPDFLSKSGRVLLGVGTFYVSPTQMEQLISKSRLRTERVIRQWPLPSHVFVLRQV